jgi:ketosteroid isomerase-like protein
VQGFLSFVHEEYSGWSNQDALPDSKATMSKYIDHFFKTRKVLVQVIKPVAINIHGDVAIVQYYYTRIVKDLEGKEKNMTGRWTDILLKHKDKWIMIGDHGGASSAN